MLQVSSKILDAIEKAKATNNSLTNCNVRIFTKAEQNNRNNIDIRFEMSNTKASEKEFKIRDITFVVESDLHHIINGKTLYFEDGHFSFRENDSSAVEN